LLTLNTKLVFKFIEISLSIKIVIDINIFF